MDASEVGAQLGLPEDPYEPPDLTVPLLAASAQVAGWAEQDSAGSADAAYALGVLALQQQRFDDARQLFERATGRGSPHAAWAMALLGGFGADPATVVDLLADADRSGSAYAAALVAYQADQRGDTATAREAFARARARAQAADALGSADAALVLATLETDPAARSEHLRRADRRGSWDGALWAGAIAEEFGRFEEAEEAYLRAYQRGRVYAGVLLGNLLARQGRRRAARRVWRNTRTAAVTAQDPVTFRAAHQALVPPVSTWFRTHRVAIAVVAVIAVAATNWRWLLVLAMLVGTVAFVRYRPVHGATFEPFGMQSWGTESFGAGSLTFSAKFTGDIDIREQPPEPLVASSWDVFATTALVVVVGVGLAAVAAAWAARTLDAGEVLRWAGFVGGLSLVLYTAQLVPRAFRPADDTGDDEGEHDALNLTVAFKPAPFVSSSFRLAVTDPRVAEVWAAVRAVRPAVTPTWSRWVNATLAAAAGVFGGVMLALPAVAPDVAPSLSAVAHLIEAVVTALLLVLCVRRIGCAARKRPNGWGTAIVVYAAVAVLVVVVSALVGVWQLPAL